MDASVKTMSAHRHTGIYSSFSKVDHHKGSAVGRPKSAPAVSLLKEDLYQFFSKGHYFVNNNEVIIQTTV